MKPRGEAAVAGAGMFLSTFLVRPDEFILFVIALGTWCHALWRMK